MKIKSKREFAAYFGNCPFKTEPLPQPSIAFGVGLSLLLPLMLIAVFAAIAYAPGAGISIMAIGPVATIGSENLLVLYERRAKAVEAMKELNALTQKEDRDFTAEEQKQWDTLDAEQAQLTKRIARTEKQEKLDEAQAKVNPSGGRPQAIPGPRPPETFESLGEFVLTAALKPNDQRLASLYREFDAGQGIRGEQEMGTGAKGGFAVPTQFLPQLLEIQPQEAVIRPRATVIPAGSPPDSAITMPALDQTGTTPHNMYGGVEVKWINEGGEKQETDLNLRPVKLEPQEVAGFITLTDKLLRNWQAAAVLVERQLRRAVIRAEDHSFFSGNGVGKPQGIVGAPATYKVNRTTANKIKYADIAEMYSRVKFGGKLNWIATQAALKEFLTMEDSEGHLIWQPTSVMANVPGMLLGLPVVMNERSPALGSKGDLMLTDLEYYLIKDGSGPFVAASEHVKFTQNKTVIKIFFNVDGQPWLTQPIKTENDYEVSPFVALDVPA